MKKDNKIKYIFLTLFFMSLIFIFLIDKHNKKNMINCITRMSYIQGDITQHLTLNFMFDAKNSSGIVHLEGIQLYDNKNKDIINRNIHFSYIKNEGNFILTSRYIRVIKGETITQNEMERTFPVFYSMENNKITYSISKQKSSGYLFLIAGMPRFFCEKM